MKSYLKINQSNGLYQITLARSEKHNAFDEAFIEEITKTFEGIAEDINARLVTVDAEGKSFCAGADLNWMKSMVGYSLEENQEDSHKLLRMFKAIHQCPVPVVSKVNGYALGGGTGIIACSDYVIASSQSKFGFTETRLGLVPAVISPFVIEKIGRSHSKSLFLSAEVFEAQKAYDIGLVHQISDDLDSDFDKLVMKFLGNSPNALRACKRLLNKLEETSSQDDLCVEMISELRTSKEGQEGMKALLEKRKPEWVEGDK